MLACDIYFDRLTLSLVFDHFGFHRIWWQLLNFKYIFLNIYFFALFDRMIPHMSTFDILGKKLDTEFQ